MQGIKIQFEFGCQVLGGVQLRSSVFSSQVRFSLHALQSFVITSIYKNLVLKNSYLYLEFIYLFLVETAAVVGLHLPAGSSSLKPPSFSGLGPNQNRGILVVGADPTEPHFFNLIYSSPFLDTRHSYCETGSML